MEPADNSVETRRPGFRVIELTPETPNFAAIQTQITDLNQSHLLDFSNPKSYENGYILPGDEDGIMQRWDEFINHKTDIHFFVALDPSGRVVGYTDLIIQEGEETDDFTFTKNKELKPVVAAARQAFSRSHTEIDMFDVDQNSPAAARRLMDAVDSFCLGNSTPDIFTYHVGHNMPAADSRNQPDVYNKKSHQFFTAAGFTEVLTLEDEEFGVWDIGMYKHLGN